MRTQLLAATLAALLAVGLSAPSRADTVTDWNAIATRVLAADGQGAPATVHLAMVHGAVYDAVNAIDRRHRPYLVAPRAKRWYSEDAAAATAAYRVLTGSRPPVVSAAQQPSLATLQPLYAASLAAVPEGPAKTGGIATGEAAAEAMIAARTGDGRFGPFRFAVGTLPGAWRPTSGVNDPFAWLKDVRPFLVADASRFGSEGPHPLTSRAYAREFEEVKALGAVNSATRTSDQTAAARFWGAANGVATWAALVRSIGDQPGRSLADNARMFARVYLTTADAAIATWIDKARFSFWRPITAIREAADDGNPATTPDPAWLPLIPAPPYPEHPSGLSAVGAATVGALQSFLGTDNVAFGTTNTAPVDPVTRSYTRLSQAIDEIVDARVWSGVHFRTADEQGAAIGRRVAHWAARHVFGERTRHRHGGRH
jgi:hypothetical protein